MSNSRQTEDEVFRKLARRPFDEIQPMVRDMQLRNRPKIKIVTALKKRGWTVEEYGQAYMKILESKWSTK